MAFCAGATLRCNTKDTEALLADDKFCALETEVEVIPKFTSDAPVDCIKGQFGPFQSSLQCTVPLWVALELDRLQQATVMLPEWMQEEELKRVRDEEAQSDRFSPVHEHYIEIAFAFLTQSRALSGDHVVKRNTLLLLREIIELRRAKIVDGIKSLDLKQPEVQNLTNMSAAELTCFRTRTFRVMDKFAELTQACRQVANKHNEMVSQDRSSDQQQESSST